VSRAGGGPNLDSRKTVVCVLPDAVSYKMFSAYDNDKFPRYFNQRHDP